jgi:hypothetical protein
MVRAKGCPTWQRQCQGIRITTALGKAMTIRITVGLKITIGSHCCATMTPGYAGSLPPEENTTDRQTQMGP